MKESAEEKLDYTTVAYVRIVAERGMWKLYIDKCPHCGKKHSHGGGALDITPELGHRVAHCLTGGKGGYELVDAAQSA